MTLLKSAPASLMFFGIYMMVIPGIGLMFFPKTMLDLNGLVYGQFLWPVRVVGLLAFIIGTYQCYIAKHHLHKLYKITVAQRYFAALFFMGLWATGETNIGIVTFAIIDAIGATWTLLTMKKTVQTKTASLQ